jgi:hypothetical protein
LQWHAEHNPGDPANYTIIMFPYLFYVFFNISWGVGSWTYAAEIFPVSMRAKGNALTTASLWAACYIVAQASPPIADAIGWGLYIIYTGICVLAFFFVRYALGSYIFCRVPFPVMQALTLSTFSGDSWPFTRRDVSPFWNRKPFGAAEWHQAHGYGKGSYRRACRGRRIARPFVIERSMSLSLKPT